MRIKKTSLAWILICCMLLPVLGLDCRAQEMEEKISCEVVSNNSISNNSISGNGTTVSGQDGLTPDSGEIDDTKPADDESQKKAVRMLFVGNSFTKFRGKNRGMNIEKQLLDLAKQTGVKLEVTTLAYGKSKLLGYAGRDSAKYWRHEKLCSMLKKKSYDYVILQEQSTVPAFALEKEMLPALRELTTLIQIEQPNAQILLYQTHAYSCKKKGKEILSSKELLRRVAAGYHVASLAYSLEVIPAGQQLERAKAICPKVPFYYRDGKHPSPNASFVMAAGFYVKAFGMPSKIDAKKQTGVTLTSKEANKLIALYGDGIQMNKGSLQIKLGKKKTVKATALKGYKSGGITYTSNNPRVATVDKKSGEIKAVGFGKTVIVAQDINGCMAFCSVSVPRKIQFSQKSYKAALGKRFSVSPIAECKKICWKSSNKKIAVVDSWGNVTTKKVGMVQIRAYDPKDKTNKAKYRLYVACKQVTGLQIQQNTKSQKTSITLTWDKADGANVYNIYRSRKSKGPFKRIAQVTSCRYVDEKIKVKKSYYYKVQASRKGYPKCDGRLSMPVKTKVIKVKKFR